jgi:hypothetical protein
MEGIARQTHPTGVPDPAAAIHTRCWFNGQLSQHESQEN